MVNMFGWAGKILRINLSKRKILKQDLSKELTAAFLGGRGVNIKILYDEVTPGTNPLSHENRVIFGAGPLVGTVAPSCSRWNVTGRSPLTEIIGDSNAGGHWAAELKWSGYDHIVFEGRSEKPVYLWINDEEVELRDAQSIWGSTVSETIKKIREEVGEDEAKVVCIGPAGEKLVLSSAVISDFTRAAARTGIAAVMGSKNLKAIAVVGTKGVKIADPDKFEALCAEAYSEILSHPLYNIWSTLGTTYLLKAVNTAGRLPIKNWTENVLKEDVAEALSGEKLYRYYTVKNKGCFSCPISCSRVYSIHEGPYAGTFSEGPEYEAQVHLGSNLGISHMEAVLHMNMLCNELGLDVCTVGATLAWAMECYEKGIITEKDTEGIKLGWGNEEAAIQMIKKIANREGLGDLLAEGPYKAAQKIGRGSEKYVIHSKTIPYTAVDPRGSFGWALAYSVSTRGADHLRGLIYVASLKSYQEQATKIFGVPREATDEWSVLGKPFFVKLCEDLCAVIDSLGICKMPAMTLMISSYFVTSSGKPEKLAQIVSAATGVNFTGEKLLEIGERIYNLEKAFNCRMGYGGREHDTIPRRFMTEVPPFPPRNTKEALVSEDKFKYLLDEYYKLRGWDVETGLLTKDKLESLGLKDVADELKGLGKLSCKETRAHERI